MLSRLASAALATLVVVLAPATATARPGVYGGLTRTGDPIVLTTDAKHRKLTSAVFRIRVEGQDDWWPIAASAKVQRSSSVRLGVLNPSRNAAGRFAAVFVKLLYSNSEHAVAGGIELTGTLKSTKASGTIRGWVTMTDIATGELASHYLTKSVKWNAERAPGRVYAGATAASLPIVIKLNPRRTQVSTLLFSCYTDISVPPGAYWSASESLVNFPLSGGRFGDVFSYPQLLGDGTTYTYDWDVSGRVTSKAATGRIAMKVTGQEKSGEPFTFEMPATKFTAATG